MMSNPASCAPEMTRKKRAVVFCPDIGGHRQIYCCVISDWFLRSGFSVILAAGRSDNNEPAVMMPLIGALAERDEVMVLDLGDTTNSDLIPGRWVNVLRAVEDRFSPEWTFLPTGDELRISLGGLGDAPGSDKVRRAAVFIHSDHCYPHDSSHKRLFLRPYHWVRWRVYQVKENLYFTDRVWSSLGLSVAFSTNPDCFRKATSPRFYYLPEVYHAWGFDHLKEQTQIRQLCLEYRDFLATHPGKDVLLYYGGWAARRGYDELLHLASTEPNTLFVSCGRPTASDQFRYDVRSLRSELRRQDRIFEVELPFLPENEFFELLYKSCNFILLPYNNFYGNSGIMVQATSFGKPVLVPSIGYMKSMVKQFGIGLTYRNNNDADFVRQFKVLRENFYKYSDNARQFGKGFDKEKVDAALAKALLRI